MEHLSAILANNVCPHPKTEMIQTIGIDIIQVAIIEDIKPAGIHGIMAEEVTCDNV